MQLTVVIQRRVDRKEGGGVGMGKGRWEGRQWGGGQRGERYRDGETGRGKHAGKGRERGGGDGEG